MRGQIVSQIRPLALLHDTYPPSGLGATAGEFADVWKVGLGDGFCLIAGGEGRAGLLPSKASKPSNPGD